MSAIWSLTGAKRTWQGKLVSVAIDPKAKSPFWHTDQPYPFTSSHLASDEDRIVVRSVSCEKRRMVKPGLSASAAFIAACASPSSAKAGYGSPAILPA